MSIFDPASRPAAADDVIFSDSHAAVLFSCRKTGILPDRSRNSLYFSGKHILYSNITSSPTSKPEQNEINENKRMIF
uniref:Uncharacterized protein n=1 Tax=Romanomermis culicivorax TaxID=13658 RepID=A0A915ID81_ROMCU